MTGGFQKCFGSFLRASGCPFFWRVLYQNPAGKYSKKFDDVHLVKSKYKLNHQSKSLGLAVE